MAIFKRHFAWLISPAPFILVLIYVGLFSNTNAFLYNPDAAASQASLLLLITGTFASFTACWSGNQFKMTYTLHQVAARRTVQVVWLWLLPSFLTAALAQLLGGSIFFFLGSVFPTPRAKLIIVAQLTALMFHTSLGFLIGCALRAIYAYPLAVFLSYLWIAHSWTVEPFFIRYLAGPAMVMCCSYVEKIDPAAPFTLIWFSFLASTAFITMALIRRWYKSLLPLCAVVLLLVSSVAGGQYFARHLTAIPTRYVTDAELLCTEGKPQVCAPTTSLQNGDLREDISVYFASLNALGMPQVIRALPYRGEESVNLAEGIAPIFYQPYMQSQQLPEMVVSAYFARHEQCVSQLTGSEEDAKFYSDFTSYISLTKSALETIISKQDATPPVIDSESAQRYWQNYQNLSTEEQNKEIVQLYKRLAACQLPDGGTS